MRNRTAVSTANDANGIDSIPGMGVIRARSFRKAGFHDVDSLRRATLEELRAVPGITEIKARQIHEYVHSPVMAPPQNGQMPTSQPTPPAQTLKLDDRLAASVWDQTRECCSMAASLLSSERARGLHNRLARQLGKIAALLTGKLGGRQLAQDEALKAWESLRKMTKLLQEISVSEHLGRRQQDELADRLRAARKKLTAILE